MKILAIDTSCDETSAAVTEGTTILSNIIWSQASLHSNWGGVYPSLAQRAHRERIDWVIEKALVTAFPKNIFPESNYHLLIAKYIDAIAVTIGPGLAIALEVGVKKAVELAKKFNKPFVSVNHIEGHLLSVLAKPKTKNFKFQISNFKLSKLFPAICLIASGKHTDIILVKSIGKYKVLAETADDALGEALDKAARMLGLGYPGGAVLEKLAVDGDMNSYKIPVPMTGREGEFTFSYSGIKTAFLRLTESEKPVNKTKIKNLAASFQNSAFLHVERMVEKALEIYKVKSFLFGGGVSANIELRKRLRKITDKNDVAFFVPYSKKLCTDNAGMIGVAAHFIANRNEFDLSAQAGKDLSNIDRLPNAKIDIPINWK